MKTFRPVFEPRSQPLSQESEPGTVLLRVVLPFKMPTLNDWMQYHPFKRSKVKNFIKGCVCAAITEGRGSQTRTISRERLLSMGFDVQEYYRMITRNG